MKPSARLFVTAAILSVSVAPLHALAQDAWITASSKHDVSTTRDKLVAAVEKAGATLFAVIDHQANAQKAGLSMEAATLVIFGNPKIGTPIMKSDRRAAIDLPIRVLIWEEAGETRLGALSSQTFKDRYNPDQAGAALDKMENALKKLMAAAGE